MNFNLHEVEERHFPETRGGYCRCGTKKPCDAAQAVAVIRELTESSSRLVDVIVEDDFDHGFFQDEVAAVRAALASVSTTSREETHGD